MRTGYGIKAVALIACLALSAPAFAAGGKGQAAQDADQDHDSDPNEAAI